ncbi:MAG: ParB/RepB/Spo0J family partition protein [Pseudomonadota bacterium]
MVRLSDKLAGKGITLDAVQEGAQPPKGSPGAGRFLEIAAERIEANPDQPRRQFDPQALEALAASIREHGLLEPLLVRLDGARVLLVAGERRLRAARLAGLGRVPCTVTTGDPAILALIENLHRQDLTPLEEAEAYARLQAERGFTLPQLAKIAGKAKSTVSEIMSLNKLAPVREIVVANPDKFPQRALVELAKQEPRRLEALAQEIAAGGVQAEGLRAQRRESRPPQAHKPPATPVSPSEGGSHLARADALVRRAEHLAGELLGINLHSLNYRQLNYADYALRPMAQALDRLFAHIKAERRKADQRWTPQRRARLLELVRTQGQAQAARELGREIYGDGQRLHPSELAEQLALARQEAQASTEDKSKPGGGDSKP